MRSLWDHPKRKEWFGGGAEFPGIHSICVEPGNSRRVVIGESCGGVWVTENPGATWTCQAKGMRAEYMPPERQFDQYIPGSSPGGLLSHRSSLSLGFHHNGVFRSTDASAKPDTAWFVPAESDQRRIPVNGRVLVSRTRDGGGSFTELTRGLPQRHAYDLTYRHALDIDATGNRLALGTTIGSLWVTVDQGDTWQTAAEHLPLVYAVRWTGGQVDRGQVCED